MVRDCRYLLRSHTGATTESPVQTGDSDVSELKRLVFVGGYKYPHLVPHQLACPALKSTINELTQNLDLSQYLHPNSLIFGGLKEKAPIYIFTKPFFIPPSFT